MDYEELSADYNQEEDFLKKLEAGCSLIDQNLKQKKTETAENILKACQEIAYTLNQPFYEARIHELYGMLFIQQMKLNMAENSLKKAMKIYSEINQTDRLICCLINAGNVENILDNKYNALEYMYEAVKLAQDNQKERYLGKIYNNISSVFLRLKDYEKGLFYARLAIRHKKGETNPLILASTCNNLGKIYSLNSDYTLSLAYYKKALKYRIMGKDFESLVSIYRNMSEVFIRQEKREKALETLYLAIELAKNFENLPALFSLLSDASVLCMDMERLTEAESCFLEMQSLQANIPSDTDLRSFYRNFARFEAKKGNISKSSEFYEKTIEIIQNDYSHNLTKELAMLNNNFEYQQKIRETELLKQKNMELAESYEQIELQSRELLQLNKSKDLILSIVAHDLKNAIGNIANFIEITWIPDVL